MSNVGKIAGAMVGVSLGVLIVILIIWLVFRKKEKKKYEEEETPNEIRYTLPLFFMCVCVFISVSRMHLKYVRRRNIYSNQLL